MHPRVKELYLNASVLAHQTEPTDLIAAELVRTKKFAELIVGECLEILNVKEYSYQNGDLAEKIKQHFGVES